MKVKFLVTPVGLMMGNVVSAKRLMRALIREGINVIDNTQTKDYDILHVHTPLPLRNIIEVRKTKKLNIPVVMHAHTTAEDSAGTWTGSTLLSGVVSKYLTYFYNNGDIVLAPSAWTKKILRAHDVSVPIMVLSNGIELERFRFTQARREWFRAKYGIPDHVPVVYMIGVVCVKKGIQTLPSVANELPEFRFVWVGRRSLLYRPLDVYRAIRRCSENVYFLYDVENIVDAHCGCDIFFAPSFVENQGIAVLEAMAVGRPVVARNLPVYEELLVADKNALLCSNTNDFITALRRLKEHPELADMLVKNAKNTILNHDIRKVAKELINIYSSLLQH